jgi:hypothetical protein
MNLNRDFDVAMFQRADRLAGLEYRWQYMDLPLGTEGDRPFLAKMRNGFRTLSQISKIRIHVTLEMREPVLEQ